MARENLRRVNKIEDELVKRMMKNLGRWCEITMKATGESFRVVRTGYGPMEYPEKDSAELRNSKGEVVCEGKTLFTVAKYICDNY